MRILTKKIMRDIKYNRGRSFSIVFIIMIAAGLYSGLLLAYEAAEFTFEEMEKDLKSHSVRYILSSYADPDNFDMDQFSYIDAWDYRAKLLSGIKIEGEDKIYTSIIFGIEADRQPSVDNYDFLEGEELDDPNALELMTTEGFFNKHQLEIGDTLELFAGVEGYEFTIQGVLFSNEFIYSVNPVSGLPDIDNLAPIWMTLEKSQELFGFSGVNEIVVRLEDSSESVRESRIDEIKDYLSDAIGPVSSIEWEDEGDQQMKEGDLGALDEFARVFGGVVLLVALFAIYDNVSKLIANQRNYIGTMRALGGSKRKVIAHYSRLAVSLGIVGVILGGPLGFVLALAMIEEFTHLLGIPKPQLSLEWPPFIEMFIVMFGLVLVISYLTSLRAARVNPREAMSSAYITQLFSGKPLMERIINKIPGFKSPSSTIAIRNIFRNRRKTLLTILTYSISTVLIIAALGFMDSFNYGIEQNYDEYQTYDLEVYFEAPMNISALSQVMDEISQIEEYEPFVSQTIDVEYEGISKSTFIFGFLEDSQLRHFNLAEGQTKQLVVGSILASELEVNVDDKIEFLGVTHEITGIARELVAEGVYMGFDEAQELLNFSNYFNGVIIELENNANENDIKEELRSSLPIATILSSQDVQDSISSLVQGLMAFVGVMVFVGFLVVAMFAFNTIVLEVISRETEFVNLRSLGSGRWKIARIILTQSLVISLVGSVIAVPLGFLITVRVIDTMVEGIMVLNPYIALETYAAGIVTAFVATLFGIVAGYRYVMKINLVNALRTRVSN